MAQFRHDIHNLLKDMETLTFGQINDKYSDLKEKCPKLFEYITTNEKNNIDMNILEQMLSLKERLDTNTIDKFQSDLILGETLGKKYIYTMDSVEEPSVEQKKQAVQKLMYKRTKT